MTPAGGDNVRKDCAVLERMILRDLFNTPPERVTKGELYLMSSGSAPWALRRLIDNPESALPNGEAYQGHEIR